MSLCQWLWARIPRRYYYVTWEGQRSFLGDRADIEQECASIREDEPDAVLTVGTKWLSPAALAQKGEWEGW